ncbi:MAG TPA: hypothetical protein VLM16_05840 [Ginsengibacter sp.]|nr:hypothetical protein [Ginsengibacter sp.]
MEADKRVQFVCFETTLDKEQFAKRWEQYSRSLNSNMDVVLQKSEKNGVFSYIAQHRFASGELEFKFINEGRNSRMVQVPIKTMLAGGYSILEANRAHNSNGSESKIFVFLTDPRADLSIYKQLFAAANLNIYQAYYQNCKYAYILEYYIRTKDGAALLEQIRNYDIAQVGIYKEYAHIKNPGNEQEKKVYVWPTS